MADRPELRVCIAREVDGRWLAEVAGLPGAMAYGNDAVTAWRTAVTLALRVMADKLEHGEPIPEMVLAMFPGYLNLGIEQLLKI